MEIVKRSDSFYFVEVSKLSNVFQYKIIRNEPRVLYYYFMKSEEMEPAYICKGNAVYGMITAGDMKRYCPGESVDTIINCTFHSVSSKKDDKNAEALFEKFPFIHEVPVVEEGKLQGVIRSGKTNDDYFCRGIKKEICDRWLNRSQWRIRELEQFINSNKAAFFCYQMPVPGGIQKALSESEVIKKEKQKWSIAGNAKKVFWGENYSAEYVKKFKDDYERIRAVIRNGISRIEDLQTDNFEVKNGHRVIPDVHFEVDCHKKVFLIGPCIVFGVYVNNEQTIAYFLQKILEEKYCNIEVVNCGQMGPNYCMGPLFVEEIGEEDIVVCMNHFGNEIQEKPYYAGELTEVYKDIESPYDYTIDGALTHCNYVINERIAERIYYDLNNNILRENAREKTACIRRKKMQDYYIPWEIAAYYREYLMNFIWQKTTEKCGAIVMNCNPFTLGHRYLIEKACEQVERLYLFVVEEDKSDFKFEDRIEMVRRGVADMSKVFVLPSGRYIISKETFAQYFEKDKVKNIESMDYDVHIFGEVVAKELGISVRFVGEEPFDRVTREYNETMKRILPEHGVEVKELPRSVTRQGEIISASKARRMLREGREERLREMLPESTIVYLRDKGFFFKKSIELE